MELPHSGIVRGFGDVFFEEGQRLGLGLLVGHGRRVDRVEEPDLVCISVTKSPISAICSGVAWMTRSGPSAIDVEVVVGDQRRDLDDDVTQRFESGHLQIHPHEHESTLLNLSGVRHARR